MRFENAGIWDSLGPIWNWMVGPVGSLGAIRAAMAVLAIAYAIQFGTGRRNTRALGWLGIAGAALATHHTLTAISAFHGGSFSEAVASTAERTYAMFGVRAGGGIYVNYAFVGAWWLDALWRLRGRPSASLGPGRRALEIATDGFLIAMAFFGAVVFASGPIRYAGLATLSVWLLAWRIGLRRRRSLAKNLSECAQESELR